MSNISEVKVYPQSGSNTLMARGSFVVAGMVKIKFSYINGSKGPFVSLPQDKVEKDGETKYYPHANFISKEAVAEVSQLVAAAYEAERSSAGNKADSTDRADNLPF